MIIVGILLLLYAGFLWWRGGVVLRQNQLELTPRKRPPEVAILIAARDESAVIGGLLKSIRKQTVKVEPEDVYVIVETLDDPTVKICRQYGNTVILREDLSKQRKGYALNEAVRQILAKGKRYDAYFIFDADNILSEDYLEQMLKIYEQGYEIATGYRNSKNGNANVIAAVSSLTFSMINVMSNRKRVAHGANIIFSGTGYYIVGDLIEEWQGWPFVSLTEDYELSLYATLHSLTTYYNEEAVFFDEQPTKYRQTVAQRVRWIKGYFSARKKYIPLIRAKKHGNNYGSLIKEKIGVRPAIYAILGVIAIMIGVVLELSLAGKAVDILGAIPGILAGVYVLLMLLTAEMIRREKLDLTPGSKIKAVLFNPIYLVTYIPCAVKALLKKDVSWTKIKHGG